MPDFRIGARLEDSIIVGDDQAIRFLGEQGPRVLSTPQMILYMERVCRNLAFPMLDPGHDTVGTHVNVSHVAAAPMGSTVTFSSELLGVNKKRLEFRVFARVGERTIGEGTHQRAIIEVSQFADRVRQENG